jgi:fibronectin type 3 domain-containing protein
MLWRPHPNRRSPRTSQFELSSLESRVLFSVAAPSNLAASAPLSVALTWQDNSTNETGFQVVRSGDGVNFWSVGTCAGNSISFTDTSVAGGYTYYYKVRAINGTEFSDFSNTAIATTPRTTVPAAPSNLSGTLKSTRKSLTATLTWQDNSSNEDMFVLQRSTDGINWAAFTVGTNTTSYTDTALARGQTYYYRVKAYNSAGSSAWSNVFVLNA